MAFNLGTYTELVDVIGASVVVDDEGVLGVTVVVVPRRGVVVVVTSLRGSVAVPVWAVVKEEFGGKSEGYEEGLNRIQLLSNSTNIINDLNCTVETSGRKVLVRAEQYVMYSSRTEW